MLINGICHCKDCNPNPTEVPVMVWQAAEDILDMLRIQDCDDNERERLEKRLTKLVKQFDQANKQ